MRYSHVKKSMRNEIFYEKLFPQMKHSRIHDTSGTPMNFKDENVKSASDSLSHEKKQWKVLRKFQSSSKFCFSQFKDFEVYIAKKKNFSLKLFLVKANNQISSNISKSHFYAPWKRQKTIDLTFTGGTELWHWSKMGSGKPYFI